MARLTAPNGAVVETSDDKVERLISMGFTSESQTSTAKKAPAKKAASSKTQK
ncbi:MAG TPA: hypothetical protein VJL80_06490 [Aeromicrobium sp.]|nr:hypothetical protein [Aeromicrobium sp.]HKY57667.1 hypothetical protein [Aeromicrobium sp.]